MLEVSDDAVMVTDLSSTNGTPSRARAQAGIAYELEEGSEVIRDEFLACFELLKLKTKRHPIRPKVYSRLPVPANLEFNVTTSIYHNGVKAPV